MQRLGAVVTGPDGDPIPVEDLGHIMGMDAFERKGRHPTLGLCTGAKQLHTRDFFQALKRIFRDLMLMRGNGIHTQGGKIIHGRPKSYCLGDRRCACFKLMRQSIRPEGAQLDFLDHVPAAHEGRHGLQKLHFPIQRADTGRSAHLVSREGQEIGIQGLHIHTQMRDRLGRIDESDCPRLMRQADDLGCRVDRAKNVGHVRKGDQLRAPGQKAAVYIQVEKAIPCHRYEIQLDAALHLQHLPGDKVGMVLHLCQEDQVAGLQVRSRPGISHQVDGLGRIACVDHLMSRRCINEPGDLHPRLLVHERGFLGQGMHPAVDVCVGAAIVTIHRIDDGQRFLRCRRRIKIHQRDARRNLALENRKIFTNFVYVEHGKGNT